MKITVTAAVIVLAAFAIIGGVFSTSAPALAQTNTTDNTIPGMSMDRGRWRHDGNDA